PIHPRRYSARAAGASETIADRDAISDLEDRPAHWFRNDSLFLTVLYEASRKDAAQIPRRHGFLVGISGGKWQRVVAACAVQPRWIAASVKRSSRRRVSCWR